MLLYWEILKIQQPITVRILVRVVMEADNAMLMWGLMWLMLSTTIWNIWILCNKRYKEDASQPMIVLLKDIVQQLDILFSNLLFKKPHLRENEEEAMTAWTQTT